jgi:hypothetical protein
MLLISTNKIVSLGSIDPPLSRTALLGGTYRIAKTIPTSDVA